MGQKYPPLKRRELIQILEHNGFRLSRHDGGSHAQYIGYINGVLHHVTVPTSQDEFVAKSRTPLEGIVKSQLRLNYKSFYAGHRTTSKRAQVSYKKFGDN